MTEHDEDNENRTLECTHARVRRAYRTGTRAYSRTEVHCDLGRWYQRHADVARLKRGKRECWRCEYFDYAPSLVDDLADCIAKACETAVWRRKHG